MQPKRQTDGRVRLKSVSITITSFISSNNSLAKSHCVRAIIIVNNMGFTR